MRSVRRKGKGEKIGREWEREEEEVGGSGEGAWGYLFCCVWDDIISYVLHPQVHNMTVVLNSCTGCYVGYGGFLQVWWRASLYIPHHCGTC